MLEQAGVETWVDAGWGIDALLGEETRPHSDLDLALPKPDLADAVSALGDVGFKPDDQMTPGLPARLVLKDGEGRRVDLIRSRSTATATGGKSSGPTRGASTLPRASRGQASWTGCRFAG